ncbi:hypothetical protein [Sagittula sp. S175]|uniref:hypothetical protein n=1 Tax=Sagittula sp. S175 TaxID=3415129 RepID=UPI003C7CA609
MPKTEERLAQEARATELNIPFRGNWKDETLAEKIAEAEAEIAAQVTAPGQGETEQPAEQAAQAEAAKAAGREGEGEAVAAPSPQPEVAVAFEDDSDIDYDHPLQRQATEELLVIVTGPKKGRWRAGRHFGKDPVGIPPEELSIEEIEALDGDPKLTVYKPVALSV